MDIDVSCLPQSKFYLKIIDIPYYSHDNPSKYLLFNDIEEIIKQNQIFDNVILISKLCVIKVSPKSDMTIVWVDIQNVQSKSRIKSLINQCFNIENYITTIRGVNMNLGMLQCKNCWRWGHTTFSCRIQRVRCIKCSSLYKTEYHCQFVQCCKVNNKVHPPQLETKKGELCPYAFKCSNCCDNHQVDSNQCLFWKHRFNYEQYSKKQIKICKNRNIL